MSKACDKCDRQYSGYGTICSKCRLLSARKGSQLACATCGEFFHGYGAHCDDCKAKVSKSRPKTAQQVVAAAHADRNQRSLLAFNGEATVTHMVHQIAHKIFQDGERTSNKYLMKRLFNKHDKDGSKSLDIHELDRAVREVGFALQEEQLQRMFAAFDIDQTGGVKYWEFIRTFGCTEDGTPQYGRDVPDLERQRREAEEAAELERRLRREADLERQRREAEEAAELERRLRREADLERQLREAEEAAELEKRLRREAEAAARREQEDREAEEAARMLRLQREAAEAARREAEAARREAEAARRAAEAQGKSGVKLGSDCTDDDIFSAMLSQMRSKHIPISGVAKMVDPDSSGETQAQGLHAALRQLDVEVPIDRVSQLLSQYSWDSRPAMPTAQFVALLRNRVGRETEQTSNVNEDAGRTVLFAQARQCLQDEAALDKHALAARLAREEAMVQQLREDLFRSSRKMASMFDKVDRDNNKYIDFREFQLALKKAGVTATDLESAILLNRYDRTGDGLLAMNEFMRLLQNSKDISVHSTEDHVWGNDGVYRESVGEQLFSRLDYRQEGSVSTLDLETRMQDIGSSVGDIAALMAHIKARVTDGVVTKCQFLEAYLAVQDRKVASGTRSRAKTLESTLKVQDREVYSSTRVRAKPVDPAPQDENKKAASSTRSRARPPDPVPEVQDRKAGSSTRSRARPLDPATEAQDKKVSSSTRSRARPLDPAQEAQDRKFASSTRVCAKPFDPAPRSHTRLKS
ncbi:unnamed protein product [Prorocentrum cordatum]|uniref:EF-hand domain-containing protein n=1 Tax=Prorocentrum cordatum TaxID=2364126 RepID=A0ABN9UTR3_9DINO|nr:unnamed protein product [Polarella glacialis]